MTETRKTDRIELDEADRLKRQRRRSIAIALALMAMAVIFFLVTIIRLGGSVANRAL